MVTVEDYLKSPKWVKRVGESFHLIFDVDNKGYVTEEDFSKHIDQLAEAVTDRPELIAKARECRLAFAKGMGISGDVKMDKQKYLEQAAAYGVFERARIEKGEMTLLESSTYVQNPRRCHNTKVIASTLAQMHPRVILYPRAL